MTINKFPVNDYSNKMSIADRVAIEGDFTGGGITSWPTDYSATTFPIVNTIGYYYAADCDRALYIPSMVVSSNKNMIVHFIWGKSQAGSAGGAHWPVYKANFASMITSPKFILTPGVPITISPGLIRSLNSGCVAVYIDNILDVDKTNTYLTVSGPSGQITDDFNYQADRTALYLGDSVSNGSGCSDKTQMMSYNFIQGLKDICGVNVRYINNSTGGYASYDHDLERQFGRFDNYSNVDYIMYAHGINNAARSFQSQGGSAPSEPTQFLADLATMYAYARRRWGTGLKFICIGSTPLNNNTNETILQTIRVAEAAWVTAQNDPNLFYVNLGWTGTFDRTIITNYSNNDGTHPLGATSQLTVITNIIKPFITANKTALSTF